jgi:hypothetical protein
MAKIKFNGLVSEVRGGVGGLVVRKKGSKFTLSDKPDMSGIEPSAAQMDQRTLFARAVAFAKMAIEDAALRAFYEPIAQQREITVYALAIGDFLGRPSLKPFDLSGYRGRAGDTIVIQAVDDIGLASLKVKILAQDGTLIEQGNAVEIGTRSGYWTYAATVPVVVGSSVFIEAEGADHAGTKVKLTENPTVGVDV